jgi:hypothetical protein
MFKDGTWKQKIGKIDQIIALTTKLTEMQARFDQQIASFATQAKNEKTTPAAPTFNPTSSGNCCSKQDSYTVAAWCLIKKEDTVTVNGREYHWCTGNHYSRGEKHNGMYADHKSSEHDKWRKNMDDCHAARDSGNKSSTKTPAPVAETPSQKLILNN